MPPAPHHQQDSAAGAETRPPLSQTRVAQPLSPSTGSGREQSTRSLLESSNWFNFPSETNAAVSHSNGAPRPMSP